MIIKEVIRMPEQADYDRLVFKPGVNVIVGKANTGKTKWLQMIDYLFGDKDAPEKALGSELAQKYDAVQALISIGGEEFLLERRWKEQGKKGKVFIEGDPVDAEDAARFLMERLRIPFVRFPKGNPYDERNWPELSWRMLLRHIYRQQRFWGDIADKQPESEQLACIFQFLGIAEHLYSEKSGKLVDARKKLYKIQVIKEHYQELLDEISTDITDEKEFQVGLTEMSLDLAITRRKSELQELGIKRTDAVNELRYSTIRESPADYAIKQKGYDQLGETWGRLQFEKDNLLALRERVEQRQLELQQYKATLVEEIDRMQRARLAVQTVANIKITHCPACDQAIDHRVSGPGHCFLCGQPQESNVSDTQGRIDLEIRRLQEEIHEAEQLVKSVKDDLEAHNLALRKTQEEIERIESQLQPIRQVVATILPPEISVLDMETGRIQEKIQQLVRLKVTLRRQADLSSQIDQLRREIQELEAVIADDSTKIPYALMADKLSNGMTSYLNALESTGGKVWSLGRVNASLREKSFAFTISNSGLSIGAGEDWSRKLGGTLTLYFLLSYHYALLNLTTQENCHYPGLVILDLPATMEDNSTVKDKENFIIQPFVQLLEMQNMENSQVIVTGAAFEDLRKINRIELKNVWR